MISSRSSEGAPAMSSSASVRGHPNLDSFRRQYPIDERCVDFFLGQSRDVQSTVLRDFKPKTDRGNSDFSPLFMVFVQRVRDRARERGGGSGPPPPRRASSRSRSPRRAPRRPPSPKRSRPFGGKDEPAGIGECESFAREYQMDDRAFEYFISSSTEVRLRTIRDFVPPRAPVEGDYSALVTGFVRTLRRATGEG